MLLMASHEKNCWFIHVPVFTHVLKVRSFYGQAMKHNYRDLHRMNVICIHEASTNMVYTCLSLMFLNYKLYK